MKTILDIPTLSGRGTLPGGIVLRDKGPGEHCRYVTHAYNDMDGKRGYHGGGYFEELSAALHDLSLRVAKAESYGSEGGGLDPAASLAHPLLREVAESGYTFPMPVDQGSAVEDEGCIPAELLERIKVAV